ncbi:RICIN domain-containing protein [Amycolatopsis australiensis]|uniref:Ricin-type beta-trefoil lectin domain-containing protein n=1 Tax=Amycolatopsis australiensis TaxID=546364 RepID=A0A1K1T6N3_9PSEU|nr:Ricin-type beta-trefoil lectin domain-containing protein [Amycolatopsis australiensis]
MPLPFPADAARCGRGGSHEDGTAGGHAALGGVRPGRRHRAGTRAHAAVTPDGWYTVTAAGSGKCVDARAAGPANGTVVQQYSCNQTASQQRQFQSTGDGVNARTNPAAAGDVTGISAAAGGLVQLWSCSNGANQQWQAVDEGAGRYRFVSRNSGKCLDVPGASTADSVQLQYTCDGTAAQSFTLTPVDTSRPDFGPNVVIFDPSTPSSTIQSRLNSIFSQRERNQFGSRRYAVMFKPGTYANDVNVGFYTQVLGLGLSPDAVTVNGAVHVEAGWFPPQNATQNFWRGAENLSVNPNGAADRWAVSQAAPYRRMDVRGDLQLDDGGWASGGWISDSKVDGQVRSGSQQQWISRTSQFGSWNGSNWNMVFAGVQGVPANTFPAPPCTTVGQTPVVREKPFLYLDGTGNYQVFVPATRTSASGTTWANGAAPGTSIPIGQFFTAKPGTTAADLDAALAAGKNLLVTPGVYHLNQALHVTRPDTVVLGLGIATLAPDNGVQIAGLLVDAGTTDSATLMQVGPAGSSADHAADNAYGLFVEHYQKTQVVRNGNGGRTSFFQNEMPYDVPNQPSWMNGSTPGFSAYRVGPDVTGHEAWGLGRYCYFSTNPSVVGAHAFEAPNTRGARFHDMVTVSLNHQGTITHVINNTGPATPSGTEAVDLVSYP